MLQAQVEAYSRQLPMMYFILIANTIALAATHLSSAPAVLTIAIPGVLSVGSLFRLAIWWRARGKVKDEAEARRMWRGTLWATGFLGAAFSAWSLSLFPYGDAYAQTHVAFFMAITVLGCIACLMHMREAAFLLAAIVLTLSVTFFSSMGNSVFIAIGVNLALVAAAMFLVLLTNNRDFAALVESRQVLLDRELETARLGQENFRLANLDGLTGLPNRRWFFSHLEAAIEEARRQSTTLSVAVIDLDGFKPVNDAFGHAAGDDLLIQAGQRLVVAGGAGSSVARLGGDEFALIIEGRHDAADLIKLGDDICAALHRPYQIDGIVAQAGGSVGFATFPGAADTSDVLFERADYALYHAKNHHRGAPVVFSADHEREIRDHSLMEQTLRQADLGRELTILFQPIVDVAEGRTVVLEALARWTSPTLGAVSPQQFIPIAERSGLICDFTRHLLAKALVDLKSLPPDMRISFNLSTRDIASPDQILRIIEIIRESGVSPDRIDLEITETAVMRDFDQGRAALKSLKSLGVRIALDDFGVGHSSLSYVHQLPLDKIKVDRSFIVELESDPTIRSVVKTVVDLCRNLQLDCVVEGVESIEQQTVLQLLGCRVMQGFLLARPMELDQIHAHLAREQQVRAASAGADNPPQARAVA